TVYQISSGGGGSAGEGPAALSAGSPLILNGPGAANKAVPRESDGVYRATLYASGLLGAGAEGSPTLSPGSYSIAAPGGADIGPFTATMNFPADLVWTNQDSIASPISRSAPLTVRWTGGGTGVTTITGSGVIVGTSAASLFICTAPTSAGTFTVPVSVLQQLPIITNDETSVGTLVVASTSDTSKGQGAFTAPLVGGGTTDQAFFTYTFSLTKQTGWN
ncbi:MAG: hypothetical protein ABI823_15595, partial [Bryobacteraceae bacterium]